MLNQLRLRHLNPKNLIDQPPRKVLLQELEKEIDLKVLYLFDLNSPFFQNKMVVLKYQNVECASLLCLLVPKLF
jgi:hypothetical protein